MAADTERAQHPCFSGDARHKFGRVHLPVAGKCNIRCNYCNRKYDCAAESRPGVTSAVLSPAQAVAYLEDVLARRPDISVAGIAGPGDPFATPQETIATLRLVRAAFPDLLLCVATNGLRIGPYLDTLAALAVGYVTVTVNAVDAAVGARLYGWVRDGAEVLPGPKAADLLANRQLEAISGLKARDVTVKVNVIVVPGVNDDHVGAVAQAVAERGADMMNCMPLYPVADTPFADLPQPSPELIAEVRAEARRFLPTMEHCTRCRADAVGMLGEPMTAEASGKLSDYAALPLDAGDTRPYVAVASREGALVNQHVGEAAHVLIYGQADGAPRLCEMRPTPAPGTGVSRWLELAATLHDCRALLVSRAGEAPMEVLTREGIAVRETCGVIVDSVSAIYAGRPLPGPAAPRASCSGDGCSESGDGCLGAGNGCG